MAEPLFTIGEMADRTGVAPSALRFYESEGLITSTRSSGGQRRYLRSTLRRVAFIRVAQRVGLSLEEIRYAMASLPSARTPTKLDWTRLSASWRPRLDEQIAVLERLRDELNDCIGCGCLSLRSCTLYNPNDVAARTGPGPRYLLGDVRPEPDEQRHQPGDERPARGDDLPPSDETATPGGPPSTRAGRPTPAAVRRSDTVTPVTAVTPVTSVTGGPSETARRA